MTRKELCSTLRQGKRVYSSLIISDSPRFPEEIKLQALWSAFVALYFCLRKISNESVVFAHSVPCFSLS